MSALTNFQTAIRAGIPAQLPPRKDLDPAVSHAPRRVIDALLSDAEKVLAVQNALRYLPTEWHRELAAEFAAELEQYGRIYMHRFRPDYAMHARPVGEYPCRTPQAAAIMLMIQNNLDPKVAKHPHELITYGGNGAVFQNWAQYLLTMQYAQGVDQARRGSIFGGYLKILPLFIFVLPGLIARALVDKGEMVITQADHTLPVMIKTLLPIGLRGIVVAGFLAALMSSLSAVFNSCSTLITFDVYKKMKPDASEAQLVRVGKISTAALVVLGFAWIPFMQYISSQVYVYLQSVQAYISPPIAAVFLLGIAWKRVNAKGAMAALWSGFVLGFARLLLELDKANLSGLLQWYATINFLHFAILLFVISVVILVVVSLLTQPEDEKKLAGLTFATAAAGPQGDLPASDPIWRGRDVWFSILLVASVGLVWLYFWK